MRTFLLEFSWAVDTSRGVPAACSEGAVTGRRAILACTRTEAGYNDV